MSDSALTGFSYGSPRFATGDLLYLVRSDGGGGFNDLKATVDDLKTYVLAGLAFPSHQHSAGDITSGTMAVARLGTGGDTGVKFLRNDQTWQVLVTGGDRVKIDGSSTMTGPLTIEQPAIGANAPLLNLSTEWTDEDENYTAIFLNVVPGPTHPTGCAFFEFQSDGTRKIVCDLNGSIDTFGTLTTRIGLYFQNTAGDETVSVTKYLTDQLTTTASIFNCQKIIANGIVQSLGIAVSTGALLTANAALDITTEWNEGATVFTAAQIAITDDASDAASKILNCLVASSSVFSIGKTGALFIGGNQVLTARKTGWTVPTGTLSRAGYATSTVTLDQVAQTLAALITDLHQTAGHGFIGT